MKTIKELFEVYKPKSPDEQKFVDKHVTIKHKDRNGNDDDVFNATNVKAIKRKEERHGYDSGEDEKVYEDLEISDEELVFELSEDVEALEEGTVGYKNYTITARANKSGQRELGDIKHVYGHEKKMNKLGVKQNDDDKYGDTHHVTVKNNETGDVTHHHVYQSYGKDSTGKPTLSIRGVGKPHEQHSKHANVIAHYLSGKTKIKEDTDLAFFEDLLEMNLDEDTFTDASLAQLRVMKHKQEMKKIESSSKLHPLMKVRRLSDAKKKLADLEAARDHYVAKHEKAQAKKKKVAEEIEDLDELSVDTLDSYRSKARKEIIDADANDDTGLYNKRAKGYRAASKSVNKKLAKEEIDDDLEAEMKAQRQTKKSVEDAKKKYRVKEEIEEKTLTPAEMKKREEIAKAMERENPGMPMAKKMAIATAQAKKVAEEVEELDELSTKTLGSYVRKAADDFQKRKPKMGYDGQLKKMQNRKVGVNRAIDKMYSLTKEDVINRAIEKYMPEDYTPPSLDEQFIAKIDHLSEAHAVTLLSLFDSLNEDNKITMINTVGTDEGIKSLLDFAIQNRGE